MMFGMFLLWGALIGLVVWGLGTLFPRLNRSRKTMECDLTALAILARRYARGDIDREEYELIRADLQKSEDAADGIDP